MPPLPPPTPEQYLAECRRRFGTANPERADIYSWLWMIQRRINPYAARSDLRLKYDYTDCAEPNWCFDRMGMSRTRLPDGRLLCIAGEHEDGYDPDFCIYNDVIVFPRGGEPDEVPEIYAYPKEVFPPTDFHSATLVGDRIILIGRLGYQDARRVGETPILSLDTRTYRVETLSAEGQPPGWIYGHHAVYEPATHSIVIRGGNIVHGQDGGRIEQYTSAHRLRLGTMCWELVAENERRRSFEIAPVDDEPYADPSAKVFRTTSVPSRPLDPDESYFRVVGEHRCFLAIPSPAGGETRIKFEGGGSGVHVDVEGDLPEDVLAAVLRDVATNIENAVGGKWTTTELPITDDESEPQSEP